MKTLAALVTLAAALFAALAWQDTPAPDHSAGIGASADSGRPQVADGVAQRLFTDLGNHIAPSPAAGLSLTDNQELIADFALHKLMDSFLLNRSDAGRMQALCDHLRRTLPAGAAAEAIQIATSYEAYLAAHDALLAAQHFSSGDAASQDLSRLSSWQQQRRQLRVRMLGERIELEWFGNDETYFTQALDEWRQRGNGETPSAAGNPEDQARHDQHMRQALNQAIASYQLAAKAN
jgi:hypothetical protein